MAKTKQISYNDPTSRKDIVMEAWIGRHWKQVLIACFILTGLSTCWGMYNINDMNSIMQKQTEAIKNLSSRVIVTTPDGRVTAIQTVDVPVDSTALHLRDIIQRYLIYSAFEIQNSATDAKQFGQIPKVKDFTAHFCADKQCINQFNAFINAVWRNYKEGTLPEIIIYAYQQQMMQKDTYTFSPNDKTFVYSTSIPVIVYIVRDGKWLKQDTILRFDLKGFLDLQKGSTMQNPIGIKIKDLKATVPTIGG